MKGSPYSLSLRAGTTLIPCRLTSRWTHTDPVNATWRTELRWEQEARRGRDTIAGSCHHPGHGPVQIDSRAVRGARRTGNGGRGCLCCSDHSCLALAAMPISVQTPGRARPEHVEAMWFPLIGVPCPLSRHARTKSSRAPTRPGPRSLAERVPERLGGQHTAELHRTGRLRVEVIQRIGDDPDLRFAASLLDVPDHNQEEVLGR